MSLTSSMLRALGLLAAGSVPAALSMSRNLLLWTGIALISGRIFGRALSWILPAAAIFPLEWFGNVAPTAAWAYPLLPPDVAAAWVVSAALLLLGLCGIRLTRWHLPRQMPRRGSSVKSDRNRSGRHDPC